MQLLRKQREYEGNPIGLTEKVATRIGEEIDKHLSSFLILYNQYHKHHWLVEGPQFRDLHLFLEENYTQIHETYDDLAERLTIMGIAPTSHPENILKLSYIEHEPEGVFRVRDMLERDMDAEGKIAVELRKSIELAIELKDFGTKNLFEKTLTQVEDRAHHIEHFLGEDTLFRKELLPEYTNGELVS